MLRDFKDFITRGNVVDLAVAVVVGAAFTAVVTSLANDVLLQLVAALVDVPDFSQLSLSVRGTEVVYGTFLAALVNFLIVAVVVFLVVRGFTRLQGMRARPEEEAAAAAETEVELLTQIRDALVGGERSGSGGPPPGPGPA